MAQHWYTRRDGIIEGPLTNAELRQHAANGQITPATEVCQAAGGEWILAGRIKYLFETPPKPILPPPSLPPMAVSYPPPPPIPNAKPNYLPPPPIQVIHAAQGLSETVTIKDYNPIYGSGTKEIELENTDTRPWVLQFLGFLIPATIGWLVFRGGCQALVKEHKKRNPPSKVQQVQKVPAATHTSLHCVCEFAGTKEAEP